jgi:hypothetical protein
MTKPEIRTAQRRKATMMRLRDVFMPCVPFIVWTTGRSVGVAWRL